MAKRLDPAIKKSVQMNFRLTKEERKRLAIVALQNKQHPSDFIRNILKPFLGFIDDKK